MSSSSPRALTRSNARSVPRHVDSVEKLLDRLALVAQVPVFYRGRRLRPHPPTHLLLSPSLLRRFHCHTGCTACCLSFTLDFTEDEFTRFLWSSDITTQAQRQFKRRRIVVNGRPFTIRSYPQYQDPSCPYLRPTRPGGALGCGFWTADTRGQGNSTQPLECASAPQIMMTTRGVGTTVLMKRPFGRGFLWKTRPQCEFDALIDHPGDLARASDLRDEIALLKRYQHWADTFGIPTHLPALIDAMRALRTTVAANGLHMVSVI